MLREYSRTKSESLAQIRATITELHHFFSKGLFFIGAPCMFAPLWQLSVSSQHISCLLAAMCERRD